MTVIKSVVEGKLFVVLQCLFFIILHSYKTKFLGVQIDETTFTHFSIRYSFRNWKYGITRKLFSDCFNSLPYDIVDDTYHILESMIVEIFSYKTTIHICAKKDGHLIILWDVEFLLYCADVVLVDRIAIKKATHHT